MPLETAQHGEEHIRRGKLVRSVAHASSPDETLSVVDIKWVGLRPSQVAPLELPSVAFKPLSRKDIAVARGFLNTPFIQVRMVFGRVVTLWFDG
jgi:hypothetical protein